MLFAEIGEKPADDLFLRLEYDGAITTNGAGLAEARQDFGALSGTRASSELMESYLKQEHHAGATLKAALKTALDAWSVGTMALAEDPIRELPAKNLIAAERGKHLGVSGIEAAILERDAKTSIRYRALSEEEVRSAVSS